MGPGGHSKARQGRLQGGEVGDRLGRVRRLQTGVSWRTQSRSGLGRVAGVNGSTYLLHFEKGRVAQDAAGGIRISKAGWRRQRSGG